VVDMALSQNVPITLALLCPDLRGGYELRLQALPSGLSSHQVLQAYFDFLSECVAQMPWAWQGWHWYSGLSPTA
jgi:hypothetical protein